jgi:hypothetical protein
MIKRLSSLLLVALLLAPLALARVISYAPYTDQASIRGHNARITRHFVLMEAAAMDIGSSDYVSRGKVVLYDSSGREEPRVVYPLGNENVTLRFAALYQPTADSTPVILIGTHEALGPQLPAIGTMVKISVDGGATWRNISELSGKQFRSDMDVDLGGPWSRGLAAAVRIGSGAYPFIVSLQEGTYAIPTTGAPKLLSPGFVVAQNREGTKFVTRTPTNKLAAVDLEGRSTEFAEADQFATYSGWITPGDDIYLMRLRQDGRFLDLYRNGQRQFITGTENAGDPSGPPMTGRASMSMFAVPSYDFASAWIIHRDAAKPTVLSRHTPGGTLQTMWSDISGPEVEALHTGSSNERLLIQVHRERAVVEVPFRDPALAVWKVGEPAPRSYDELFLNEGITKGFVHVDAETIAGGDPFVFDSGFERQMPDIIVSPPISGGGDVIQEWGVVRASLKQRLVLPGVARLPGAFGSFWYTDVVIYNPLDEKQAVDVQFVALGEEIQIAAANTVKLTLEPREIRVLNDALKTMFNVDNGGGALYFMPAQGVNVSGRTYSRAAEGGGTFGFGMMAIDFWNAAGPRFPLSFAGAFPGPSFRTNVLLTDTSGRGTAARMQAYGVSGTMGSSEVSFNAPMNGVTQANNVGGALGLFSHQSGGLVVQPTSGTAIPIVVAIDNRTNDPTYFPPDLPASTIRTIPVIGHVDGAHGSRFRSDIYLINLSPQARQVTLEVKRWDSNEFPRRLTFTMLPSEARVIDDVLMKLFGIEGLARLRYWSDGGQGDASGIRVTSRTYNIDSSGATYGSLIPPLNNFQSAAPGESLEIIGIVGGSGFRTNLGLVELGQVFNNLTANVRLTIFDEKGKQIDRFTVTIPVAGGMQINDLFGARGITAPAAARVVVEVLDTGLVGAYATLTDNVTNDTTFLGANLGASQE